MSKQRAILVVGGGQGIGLETTTYLLSHAPATVQIFVFGLHIDPQLHRHNAHVHVQGTGESQGQGQASRLHGQTQGQAQAQAQAQPSRLHILQGDVTNAVDRQKAIQTCLDVAGVIDSLVYCAGLMTPIQRIEKVDLDAVKLAYAVNVFGVIAMCQLALPHLHVSPCPRVIILSSACDLNVTYHGWMSYCTTKAALSRFIGLLALENPAICVQGVYPRLTDTRMPADVIEGKYDGIMTQDEVALFRSRARDGITLEPAAWCAEAVARLAVGSDNGGKSGLVMYYDEHVPDLLRKKKAKL
ncbi:hypothetical protein A1O3_07035 [Capronia epimyces CBS 606.96]|uniref:Uncharacterized protein n=1 Tax=Capronia epimyces CBS 606.96 TaxID=1182542 RepID=W9XUS2_9EURO|nr:uncharacterized protein A1O3_07035 [Capronia epimyces CBS 606.96]EXJ80751.1 hypothetical protein A1O3_07035 [Capronia epimyces CBS 606.96]